MPTSHRFPFYLTQVLLAFCVLLYGASAQAQGSAAPPPLLAQATTLEGAGFDASALKGKVVMLFYWSTRCAVCRSHLPELRANMVGWRSKPFVLVTVNVDSDASEWRAYEHLVAQTQSARPLVLWSPGQGRGQTAVDAGARWQWQGTGPPRRPHRARSVGRRGGDTAVTPPPASATNRRSLHRK